MTRLSQALDRANEDHDNPLPPVSAPWGWDFDGEDRRRTIAEAPRPAAHLADTARESEAAVVEAPPPALLTRVSEEIRRKVVVGPEANRGVVEQYRRLAAVLHHAQSDRRARSVMIASAAPGEGKTLTSVNLALTLSESYQRRVLLIDADLRRPAIHSMLGLPNTIGLVDSLSAPTDGRLPVQAVSPTLWVLTAGRPSPDPMGMLVSDAMQQLLIEAMSTFDWVVVDTPPVAILSDANLLAAMIDTALLVVQAHATPYPMVQRAIGALGASKILGVVLNRAEGAALPDGYGSYGDQERWGGAPKAARRPWLHRRANGNV